MMARLKDLIERLSSEDIPLSYVLLTFLASVMLRTFWEHTLLVQAPVSTGWGMDHAHYLFFYIALALSLTCLLYALTGERIVRIIRVVFPAFIALNLVPFVDRVFGARDAFHVSYYFPDKHPDILTHFLFFFGPLEQTGATPGMRVEIALVLLLSGLYVFIKTRQLWHAVIGALLVYALIFAFIATPVVVQMVGGLFNIQPQTDMAFIVRLYLLIIFPLGLLVSYWAAPDVFKALVRDLRWMRLAHYLLLILLGAVVSSKEALGMVSVGQEGFFRIFFLVFSTTLAWAFSVISNNWADTAIDCVSNPQRPSVTGVVAPEVYRRIGWCCLWGAGIYALAVSAATLEIVAVFSGAYFIYSMPPLRLKRLTVLSKFVLGFNALLMFMQGYMFWLDATTVALPIILFFLLFMSLSSNFIDLKDVEGDRAAGVKTLPVVLGAVWAKRLIGLAFILTYMAAFETFHLKGCFLVCFVTGLVQCVLVNRVKYDEKPLLWVHLASLIFIISYVVVTTGGMF